MQPSKVASSSATAGGGSTEKANNGTSPSANGLPTQNLGWAPGAPSGVAAAPAAPSPTSLRFALTEGDGEDIRLMASALARERPPSPRIPVYALPDQAYLETTVLPLLLRGLEELSKVRPPDPLTFLAAYLIGNNPQRSAAPLLSNTDERRIPLMEIALRAAAGFEVHPPSAQGGAPLK